MFEANKLDKEFNNIRDAIINNKEKFKNIIFSKYNVTNKVFN